MTATTAADLSVEDLNATVRHLLERIADLESKLRRAHTDLAVADGLNQEREWEIDGKNAEICRLSASNRELAVENEDLRAQHEYDQQETPPAHKPWRVRLLQRIRNRP